MSQDFPVRVGQRRGYIEVEWNSAPDLDELREWVYAGDDRRLLDASDYAVSVIDKWRAAVRSGSAVVSFDEMKERIAANPKEEVVGILFSRPAHGDIGLSCALFHRTWSGNLYLDFLLTNPHTQLGENRISGSSYWLLLALCDMADALPAKLIWGETTDISAGFYRKTFGVRERDVLVVTPQKRRNFRTFLQTEVRPNFDKLPELTAS